MNNSLKKYIPIGIIFFISLYFQTRIPVNPDTSWLIICAKRLLAGGNYFQDFFEVNPPASIYIYIPIVLIAKWLPFNVLLITQGYIFFIALVSFILCTSIINEILKDQAVLACWIKAALFWLYLILPAFAFGEREHIVIMLVMPYVFLIPTLIQQQPVSITKRINVSLFAAIAFLIKPFFLLCFMLSEIFLWIKTRKAKHLYRFENWLVIAVIAFYVLSIIFITPEYVTKVLPFIHNLYYEVVGYSWSVMLRTYSFDFYLVVAFCYLLIRQYQKNKVLADLLFCYSSIFLLIFLVQRTLWFYHAMPLVSFLILLNVLLVCDFLCYQFSKLEKMKSIVLFKVCFTNFVLMVFLLLAIIGSLQLNLYGLNKIYPEQLKENKRVLDKIVNNKPIFYFSSNIWAANPVTNYLNLDSASRFASFWMLAKLMHLTESENLQKRQMAIDKLNFVIEATIEDINRWQPQLVFVVTKGQQLLSGEITVVDYLELFSQNKKFKRVWQNYQYIGNFGCCSIYSRKY